MLPPKSSVVGLCFFLFVFRFFRPLHLLIVIMGASSRGALRHRQSRRKTPFAACNLGGKKNLKGVTKRKQQQIICKVPKTTRGKETTTSSLQITAQAIYLVTVCLFQAFEGLSCFYGFLKCVYLFILHFVPIIIFFFCHWHDSVIQTWLRILKNKPQNCLTRVLCFTAE